MKRDVSRTIKLESFIGTPIFDDELEKVKQLTGDEQTIRIVKICDKWKLSWECFDIIQHYINESEWDFSIGDKGFRIIDYGNQLAYPAESPHDEFRVMQALAPTKDSGVYIRVATDRTKDELINFITDNYESLKQSLDDNHPNRAKTQKADSYASRKARIYLLFEQGIPVDKIARQENCESAYVRRIHKEIKDLIIPRF